MQLVSSFLQGEVLRINSLRKNPGARATLCSTHCPIYISDIMRTQVWIREKQDFIYIVIKERYRQGF